MSSLKVNCKGLIFTCRLFDLKSFIRKLEAVEGKGTYNVKPSGGFVLPSTQEIYFVDDYFTVPTIRHELWHAYATATFLDNSTPLDAAQLEEFSACIFEYHGDEMTQLAKKIYKTLAKK